MTKKEKMQRQKQAKSTALGRLLKKTEYRIIPALIN